MLRAVLRLLRRLHRAWPAPSGGVVTLRPPDWAVDPDELAAAFSPRTRLVLLNTPHNPTGKVFSRAELELIAAHCRERDVLAVTDEVYEHLVFDGRARRARHAAREWPSGR